jgi:hypothetical protein
MRIKGINKKEYNRKWFDLIKWYIYMKWYI